jgi:hypothetical protein
VDLELLRFLIDCFEDSQIYQLMMDTFVAVSTAVLLLATVAIAAAACIPFQTQDLKVLKRLTQLAAILRCMVHHSFTSSMIPIAYSLCPDPAKSGALIAATQGFSSLGAVCARLALSSYTITKLAMLLLTVFFCVNAFANALCSYALNADVLVPAFLITRSVHGFLSAALGVVLEAIVFKVTPAKEITTFWQVYFLAIASGFGLGLLFVERLSQFSPDPVRLATLAAYIIAQVVAGTGILCLLAMPRDLSVEHYEEMDATMTPSSANLFGSEAPMSVVAGGSLETQSRRFLWLVGVFAWINSACIIMCCQVGCPMLLEVHFGWSTANLALGQGLAFICAVPLFFPLLRLSDARGPMALSAVAMAGALSLTLETRGIPEGYLPSIVLGTTAVIYVLVASGTSLFFAAAGSASLADSICSKDNLIIITYVDGTCSLVVAMVSRQLIFTRGIVGYAVTLAALLFLQCILGLIMTSLFVCTKRRTESAAFPLRAELSLIPR